MKNKKKVLQLVLIGILTLTAGLPTLASEVEEPIKSELSFTDLDQGKWYTESMVDLAEKGILKGFKGEIKPNSNLTRAEYIQILDNIIKFDGIIDLEDTPNLKESDWFFEAVRGAIAGGILKADEDMALRPRDPLTREEMFVITVRAFDLENLKNPVTKDYTETYKDGKDVSQWSKESINILLDQGLIKGNQENKLLPKKNITRAEASILISAMEKVKSLKPSGSVVMKPIEKPNKPGTFPNFSNDGNPVLSAECYPPKYVDHLPDGARLSNYIKDLYTNDIFEPAPGDPYTWDLWELAYEIGYKLPNGGVANKMVACYVVNSDKTHGGIVFVVGDDNNGEMFFYTLHIDSKHESFTHKPAFESEDFDEITDLALNFLAGVEPYIDNIYKALK